MKIGISEDGEASDDWIVQSRPQRLGSVDLTSGLVLKLPGKTKKRSMKIRDNGDVMLAGDYIYLETRMLENN